MSFLLVGAFGLLDDFSLESPLVENPIIGEDCFIDEYRSVMNNSLDESVVSDMDCSYDWESSCYVSDERDFVSSPYSQSTYSSLEADHLDAVEIQEDSWCSSLENSLIDRVNEIKINRYDAPNTSEGATQVCRYPSTPSRLKWKSGPRTRVYSTKGPNISSRRTLFPTNDRPRVTASTNRDEDLTQPWMSLQLMEGNTVPDILFHHEPTHDSNTTHRLEKH